MLRATTTFVAEMKNVSWWASRFGLYRKINDHISEIKMCMYSLVVLLNLNILMSSERLRYPGNVLFCSEKKWERNLSAVRICRTARDCSTFGFSHRFPMWRNIYCRAFTVTPTQANNSEACVWLLAVNN